MYTDCRFALVVRFLPFSSSIAQSKKAHLVPFSSTSMVSIEEIRSSHASFVGFGGVQLSAFTVGHTRSSPEFLFGGLPLRPSNPVFAFLEVGSGVSATEAFDLRPRFLALLAFEAVGRPPIFSKYASRISFAPLLRMLEKLCSHTNFQKRV